MSQSIPNGQEPNGRVESQINSFVDTVTDALETCEADETAVDAVEAEGRRLAEHVGDTVDELRDEVDDVTETVNERPTIEVDDDGDPLASIKVDGLPLGRALRSKVTETDVEAILDEREPAGDESDPSEPQGQDAETGLQTPLERVCAVDETEVGAHLTANQERARFVAKGITDYGRKVPAGIAVTSSEIRRVLAASEEKSIHTQTVTRVMDFLDDLGGDDVEVRKTRSGKRTVVFSEKLVSRITAVVTRDDGPPVMETAI